MVNSVKKTALLFSFIFLYYIPESYCSLEDVALVQQMDEFIAQSINKIDETSLTPETLHILCNVFYSAFEYARLDIESSSLKRMVLAELNKMGTTNFDAVNSAAEALQALTNYEKAKFFALQRWNHVSKYMDENETVANLFRTIATERLQFLNSHVKNNYTEFSHLIAELLANSRESIQKLHTVANFLRAASEKALPFDYEDTYAELKEIDLVAQITQQMKNEMDTLRTSLISFEQYNETFLTLCALLDMFYFNRLHERLIQKSQESTYHTILFNENGLVPEEERVDLLPYVLN